MSRRTKILLVLALLFAVLNGGGAIYAAMHGEVLHAFTHAVLALPAAWLVGRLLARRVSAY